MNNQFKLKYRPEIDGLRALAVLGVIFYHVEIFLFDKNRLLNILFLSNLNIFKKSLKLIYLYNFLF